MTKGGFLGTQHLFFAHFTNFACAFLTVIFSKMSNYRIRFFWRQKISKRPRRFLANYHKLAFIAVRKKIDSPLKSAGIKISNFHFSNVILFMLSTMSQNSFLVSMRDLGCQQEVSLALTKTLPIHYYNVVDSAFSNYSGVVAYLRILWRIWTQMEFTRVMNATRWIWFLGLKHLFS